MNVCCLSDFVSTGKYAPKNEVMNAPISAELFCFASFLRSFSKSHINLPYRALFFTENEFTDSSWRRRDPKHVSNAQFWGYVSGNHRFLYRNYTGSETEFSAKVVGHEVTVHCSSGQHNHGSSKVKLINRIDYNWEFHYYRGQLVAVHINGKIVAYGMKGL